MRARPSEPLATWCEARLDVCTGRATCRHHLAGRLKSPALPDPDAASNTKDLCDACHRWAHEHPARAYELGLLRKRLALPPMPDDEDGPADDEWITRAYESDVPWRVR